MQITSVIYNQTLKHVQEKLLRFYQTQVCKWKFKVENKYYDLDFEDKESEDKIILGEFMF
jgi:hypothetical protein